MHLALYRKGKRKNPPCTLCRDFVPHFHPERIDEIYHVAKPSKIFACSTSDFFAPWTKEDWQHDILEELCGGKTPHIIQFLTKCPERIHRIDWPENIWLGATVTNQGEADRMIRDLTQGVGASVHYVSFEPLLGPVKPELADIEWIIIGKLTGSRKVPLQKEWVQSLIDQARSRNIPVFVKNNVGWPEKIQYFPAVR